MQTGELTNKEKREAIKEIVETLRKTNDANEPSIVNFIPLIEPFFKEHLPNGSVEDKILIIKAFMRKNTKYLKDLPPSSDLREVFVKLLEAMFALRPQHGLCLSNEIRAIKSDAVQKYYNTKWHSVHLLCKDIEHFVCREYLKDLGEEVSSSESSEEESIKIPKKPENKSMEYKGQYKEEEKEGIDLDNIAINMPDENQNPSNLSQAGQTSQTKKVEKANKDASCTIF